MSKQKDMLVLFFIYFNDFTTKLDFLSHNIPSY